MDNVNLSQANQVHISNQAQNKNTTSSIQPQVQQTEDGKNKINKVLIGLGVLGAATIGITCIIRGRKPKNTSDVQKLIKQFQDIDFNKGTAKLKDGTLFTGAIEDTLKSGDKVTMKYVDGILQKSTKTTNGAEVVKEYTNGVISKKNGEVVDIKEVQNEVKTQQDKLKKLLADNKLSSQDFNTQANEIKFKSKKQQAEIKSTFDKKVQSEEAAKAEAEKLAEKLAHEQKITSLEEKVKLARENCAIASQNQNTTFENIAYSKAQIERLRAEIELEEAQGHTYLYELKKELKGWEGNLKHYEKRLQKEIAHSEAISRIQTDWAKTDEQLKETYYNVALGKQKMSSEDWKALKELYGKKFEAEAQYGTKATTLEYHHKVSGMNPLIRQELARSGKSAMAEELAADFEKLNPISDDMIFYRGRTKSLLESFNTDFDIIENAKVGDIIIPDTACSYLAHHRKLAESFGDDMIYEVRVPKGAKISINREHGGEGIMPPGAKYKLIEKGKDPDDKLYVILEYILPQN